MNLDKIKNLDIGVRMTWHIPKQDDIPSTREEVILLSAKDDWIHVLTDPYYWTEEFATPTAQLIEAAKADKMDDVIKEHTEFDEAVCSIQVKEDGTFATVMGYRCRLYKCF